MNSINILTVNRTHKILSTEVSSLELTYHALKELNNHTLNELHFRSERTGKEVVFFLEHIESHEHECETFFWRFKPSASSCVEHPDLEGWTLVVFND